MDVVEHVRNPNPSCLGPMLTDGQGLLEHTEGVGMGPMVLEGNNPEMLLG